MVQIWVIVVLLKNVMLLKYWCNSQLVFYYLKISNFLWRKNAAYYTPIGVYIPIETFDLSPVCLCLIWHKEWYISIKSTQNDAGSLNWMYLPKTIKDIKRTFLSNYQAFKFIYISRDTMLLDQIQLRPNFEC